jgi:hypothetical protein
MNKLRLSETSLESVAKVMLGVGEIVNKNKGVNDTLEADDIVQPLKTKLIYYLIGTGAVKKGAGNINPNKTKTNNDPLLTVKLSTKHGGIQLDKTHEADGAHLSIMT